MERREQIRFWIIGLRVLLLALYLLRGVLLPFVAGMAVAYVLDPVCDKLEDWGLGRTWATTVVTLAFVVILAAVLLLVLPILAEQLLNLIARVPAVIDAIRAQVVAWIHTLELRVDAALLERLRSSLGEATGTLVSWASSVLGGVISGGVALVNLLSLLFITPVVAFYLLRDWDRLVGKVDGWLPRRHAETIRKQVKEIDRTLAGWARGQGTVCLLLGVGYAIGLTLLGLDFGLIVGLIAGVLSFIPYLGSITGFLLSVGLAMLQFDEIWRIAAVAAVFFAGQAIEGNILTPKLVGDKAGLHPVWVIFALLAGGALFGFVGVLLAVPVAAVVGVLVRFALDCYLKSPLYDGGEGGEGGDAGSQGEQT
jgi:predicted PurR-regulated permease PerM